MWVAFQSIRQNIYTWLIPIRKPMETTASPDKDRVAIYFLRFSNFHLFYQPWTRERDILLLNYINSSHVQISNSRILKYIPSVHFNKLPWQFVSQIEGLYCWDLDYCWGKSQECGPQLQLAGMVLRALLCLLFTSNIFSIKWRWKGWLRECLRFLSPLRFLWGRDDILPWHPILGTLPSLLLSQSVTTCCHDLWEGMTQLQWIKNKNNQIPGFWISKGHVQTKVI